MAKNHFFCSENIHREKIESIKFMEKNRIRISTNSFDNLKSQIVKSQPLFEFNSPYCASYQHEINVK
jgi:hypothetical protein